jgi:hypothetical protein
VEASVSLGCAGSRDSRPVFVEVTQPTNTGGNAGLRPENGDTSADDPGPEDEPGVFGGVFDKATSIGVSVGSTTAMVPPLWLLTGSTSVMRASDEDTAE